MHTNFHSPAYALLRLALSQVPDDVEEQYQQVAGARVLLLDRSGNLHSIYRPSGSVGGERGDKSVELTGSYWDYLATLPSLVPHSKVAPIAILGLVSTAYLHAVLIK